MTDKKFTFSTQDLCHKFPEDQEITNRLWYELIHRTEARTLSEISIGDIAILEGPAAAYWYARILPIEFNKQLIKSIHYAIEKVTIRSGSIELMGASNLINNWVHDVPLSTVFLDVMDDVYCTFVKDTQRSAQRYTAQAIIEVWRIIIELEEQRWCPDLFSHAWFFVESAVELAVMDRIPFRHHQIAKICEVFPPTLKALIDFEDNISKLITGNISDEILPKLDPPKPIEKAES